MFTERERGFNDNDTNADIQLPIRIAVVFHSKDGQQVAKYEYYESQAYHRSD